MGELGGSRLGDVSQELAVTIDDDGLVLVGDRADIDRYVDGLRHHLTSVDKGTEINTQTLLDLGSGAAALAALGATSGEFVRLSPGSLGLLHGNQLIPGDPGFYRMAVRGDAGRFTDQMQWQPAMLDAQQALALQTAVVNLALRAAIDNVQKSVDRLDAKVTDLRALAGAERAGEVLGNHATLTRLVADLDDSGHLSQTDWQSVARLGLELEARVEKLREHARRKIQTVTADHSVRDRAKKLGVEVEERGIGEILRLLVVAEDAVFLWHRLRIERVRTSEPPHLERTVGTARTLLRDQLRADGELVGELKEWLIGCRVLRPLDYWRGGAAAEVEASVSALREELADFARARRAQVADWPDVSQPTLQEAVAEAQQRAAVAGRSALALGKKAWDMNSVAFGIVSETAVEVARQVSAKKRASEPESPSTGASEGSELGDEPSGAAHAEQPEAWRKSPSEESD